MPRRRGCGATIRRCGSSRSAPTSWDRCRRSTHARGGWASFPGSTIGNLEPAEATAFLRNARQLLGDDGALVLGVDLKKDPQRLHDAYNDSAGVTAAFTLNLLRRMNRELHAKFDLAASRTRRSTIRSRAGSKSTSAACAISR